MEPTPFKKYLRCLITSHWLMRLWELTRLFLEILSLTMLHSNIHFPRQLFLRIYLLTSKKDNTLHLWAKVGQENLLLLSLSRSFIKFNQEKSCLERITKSKSMLQVWGNKLDWWIKKLRCFLGRLKVIYVMALNIIHKQTCMRLLIERDACNFYKTKNVFLKDLSQM